MERFIELAARFFIEENPFSLKFHRGMYVSWTKTSPKFFKRLYLLAVYAMLLLICPAFLIDALTGEGSYTLVFHEMNLVLSAFLCIISFCLFVAFLGHGLYSTIVCNWWFQDR